jgi:hypothetical protein
MNFECPHLIILVYLCLLFCQGHPSFSLLPPLPEEGPLPDESAMSDNEAPEAVERWDGHGLMSFHTCSTLFCHLFILIRSASYLD